MHEQGWKCILPTGMESTKLVNGHTFHWCSKCMPPHLSTTHVMHNLDFDTAGWVVNIPYPNMKLAFSNDLPHAKAPTPWSAFQTKYNLRCTPPISNLVKQKGMIMDRGSPESDLP